MDYANDQNTPFIQRPGAMKRLAVVVGGGMLLLIVGLIAFSAVFGTGDQELAMDQSISRLQIVDGIADLASSYSDDPYVENTAASASALSKTHINDLRQIKIEVYGADFTAVAPDLTKQDAELDEATKNGTQNELAADFIEQSLQGAINELANLQSQLPAAYHQQLKDMRSDLAVLLAD